MRSAFDLDGTLYDTLPFSIRAENILLEKHQVTAPDGTPVQVNADTLRQIFQSVNFDRYYEALGIADPEERKIMIQEFYPIFDSLGLPELLPGAKELLTRAESSLGLGNIHFITNATPQNYQARFRRDGLERYLPQVRDTLQGKAALLLQLAAQTQSRLIYVGDMVCDGEECFKARDFGADLHFYGLTHESAFSHPEAMRAFVKKHPAWAVSVNSLEELSRKLFPFTMPELDQ